jgi:hypothetical protein
MPFTWSWNRSPKPPSPPAYLLRYRQHSQQSQAGGALAPPPYDATDLSPQERLEVLRRFSSYLLALDYRPHGINLTPNKPHGPEGLTRRTWWRGVHLIASLYHDYISEHPDGDVRMPEWADTCRQWEWLELHPYEPAKILGLERTFLVAFLMDFIEYSKWHKCSIYPKMPRPGQMRWSRGRWALAARLCLHRTMMETVVPKDCPSFRKIVQENFHKRVQKHFSGIRGLDKVADEVRASLQSHPAGQPTPGRRLYKRETKMMIAVQWVMALESKDRDTCERQWSGRSGRMSSKLVRAEQAQKALGYLPKERRVRRKQF